jgi:hypothetical protein
MGDLVSTRVIPWGRERCIPKKTSVMMNVTHRRAPSAAEAFMQFTAELKLPA